MALLDLDPDQLLSTTRAVRKRLDFARPVLVLGCNEGTDRTSALAGLGNILPAMWSFMLAARWRTPRGRISSRPPGRIRTR